MKEKLRFMIKLLCLRFVHIKYVFNFGSRPHSNILLFHFLDLNSSIRQKKFQMKRFYTLMLAFACCVSFRALGQTVTPRPNENINANCNGFLQILPQGYNSAAPTTYPTIIFFMGINSDGPGTLASLQALITGSPANPPSQPNPNPGNGFIQDQVAAGIFPATFSGGNKFIVIVPQFIINYNVRPPTPSEVNDVINRAILLYKVDTTRIYLTGNSSGGGPVWDYPAFSSDYANRIAAIVPFCGVSFPSKEKADVIRNADIAVWAFHNDLDGGVPSAFTKDFVNLINNPSPASPEVKYSLLVPPPPLPPTAHDIWFEPYMRIYTENGLNIYDWMLQFQRPVTKAKAGNDQNITLPTNTAQLAGSGTGPNGGVTTINWQLLSGPGGGAISNPAIMNPTVSGLVYGAYFYRLSITDGGGTSTDDVVITVYPPRIQAENYVTASGITLNPALDEGGGSSMRDWNAPGAFAEYNINPSSAGTYILRFRLAAWYTAPALVVKSGSTVLANMPIYWTGSWDNYITMTRNVTLPAGPQTLRIESTNSQDFNLNWMQLMDVGAAGPLPVKFSLLNAACDNGKVRITWKTALEENLEGFAVEKSKDGRNWNQVSFVKANGNSSGEQSYSFTDNEINGGNQYRIAGVDLDGEKTYSTIIKGNCSSKYEFSVYPNPVFNEAQISLDLQHATKVNLVVVDSRGAVVLRQEKNALQGSNLVTMSMSSLPAGNYTLTAQWDDETRSVKLIKQ